jgi:rhodanese-related sulfurtransferase
MFRPTDRRPLVSLVLVGAALFAPAARADEGNPRIDYRRFAAGVAAVEELRQARRIGEDEFMALAARPDTVVLDARSREKYDLLHVRGARHLNFSDITAAELAKAIPTKDTRVLIYCNNNFENEEQAFATKTAGAALNVHTFNVLHAYGYTNVRELKPLLDVRTTKIPFAGATADARGRYAKR